MNSNTNSNSFHVIYLLSNTWKSFWQRTDIAGVTNAREAQSSLRKKIWIVLSTVFFILTVSSLYQVLHEYTHYPVTTSITVKYQNQIEFPAVTVCNQNRVNCEKLTTVKNACEETIMNQRINETNPSIDHNSASVTICNHMYDESKSLLQHLYDDGKCGTICRGAAKCFCIELFNHTRHSTIQEQNKEIVCEENGGLVPSGKCGEDEWCTGPYHRDYAECGKANLCEPKSCFNDKKDNGEEGFDCGGPCRRKCVVCTTKESWNRRSNYDPGQRCIFPFKYKGIEYTECIDVDSENDGNSYFWCATKINENKEIDEGGRHWGECNDYCRRHGVCVPYSLAACEDAAKAFEKKVNGSNHEFASSTYKTKGCHGYIKGSPNEWQNEYVDYIYYGTGGAKEQIQYGVSSPEYRPPGYDCRYDIITSNADNDQSPTSATDTECKTDGGRPCVFPFIYKDKEYSSCTYLHNKGVSWCATKTDAEGKLVDNEWGNCDEGCPGVSSMCTGNFQEEEKRPPAGTPCVGLCVMEAGRWGSSYCYTDLDEYQWGAECVSCQGVCTGTYKEDDGKNGTLRATPGTICKSDCEINDGYWGSSLCYTEADHSQWGAECVICNCNEEDKYTEKTCKAAAFTLGMELGKGNAKFADNHHIKGCHAFKTGFYKGSVFYGLGGNEKEISEDFDLDATAYRPKGYDCSSNDGGSQKGPKMCTGYFIDAANSPLTGTGCVYPCVYEMGGWGSSYCYTNLDKSEWGAECIPCSEMCTGSYTEEGKPLAATGTKCESPCIHKGGRWGASFCYTNLTDKENGWGAECVPCSGECVPYSGQACIKAGEKLGLTNGKFGWNYAEYNDQHKNTDIKPNGIKGCYAYSGGEYKGSFWYGIGASAEIKGSLAHTEEFYRPEGFDCQIETKAKQPPSFGKEMKFLKNFMSMNEEERKLIGHNFTSMFKACTFRGNDCLEEKNFMELNVAQYGNCYSFNSKYNLQDDILYQIEDKKHVDKGQRRLSSLTGPSFGLNLIVALDQIDYMKGGITKQAGVSLTVHGIEEWPLIDEYGMDISPSSYTKVAITETKLKREKYPHPSNCTQSWNTTGFNDTAKLSIDNDEMTLNYNLAQCQRFCLFEAIVKHCGCLHPLYTDFDHLRHLYIKDNKTTKLETCDLFGGEPDEICKSKTLKEIDDGKRTCSCGVNCEETQYEVKLSSSDWPSQDFVKEAKRRFGGQRDFFGGAGFKDNFAQIGVYFQSLNTKLIYEEPKYTLTSLTGAIGGSLSLYLGISIAMMFEVFEFIVDIFLTLFTFYVVKRCRANPNS